MFYWCSVLSQNFEFKFNVLSFPLLTLLPPSLSRVRMSTPGLSWSWLPPLHLALNPVTQRAARTHSPTRWNTHKCSLTHRQTDIHSHCRMFKYTPPWQVLCNSMEHETKVRQPLPQTQKTKWPLWLKQKKILIVGYQFCFALTSF